MKLMTGKVLSFSQIPLNTTIKELKLKVEDACGIPSQCQRLTYLDMCDMFDHKTLEQSDVVDKGRFNMKVRILHILLLVIFREYLCFLT